MKIVNHNKNQGFVLVLVIICILVLLGVALYSINATVKQLRNSANYQAKTKAFYAAEGGLNRAVGQISRGYLDSQDSRFVAFDPLDPKGIFKQYVDNADTGLYRYREQSPGKGEYLLSGKSGHGLGTVDYKVLLSDIADLEGNNLTNPSGDATDHSLEQQLFAGHKRLGRDVELKSSAQNKRGVQSTVKQHVILSYLPNIIFKYGMLTNRLKECQFCHMQIQGDIGQVGGAHFSPISPHVTIGIVKGDIYLSGDFRLDQHPAHQQLFKLDGQLVEHVEDTDLLPLNWPSILSRLDPKKPEIAGFYVNLADKATTKGTAYLDGGEILIQLDETDRFLRVPNLRGVVRNHVILKGTKENPLHIDGPLVIKGDLIISGVVTGQGSIYVERNIYLIGNITYKIRPKEDEWGNVFAAEMQRRQSLFSKSDFKFDKLGLFSGGNVIVGNLADSEVYRYINYFLNYESSGMIQDPKNRTAATQRFEQENLYDPLGLYTMDGASGVRLATIHAFRYNDRYEDGSDYNKNGKKAWGEGMRWINRSGVEIASTGILPAGSTNEAFLGGWISRDKYHQLASKSQATVIDATIYTDGAFTGFKASNDKGKSELEEYKIGRDLDGDGLTFNGAVIARDIDVLAPGGWYVRYDNRNFVGEGAALNFEPSRVVEITGWREE